MRNIVKVIALASLLAPTLYADTTACKACHGASFEKAAMGVSKVVKDMSKADIVAALKGYKDGSYGGAMKNLMTSQVANFDEVAMAAIADEILGGGATVVEAPKAEPKAEVPKAEAPAPAGTLTSNASEKELGLRKTDLYRESDSTVGTKTEYSTDAAGTSTKIERAFTNAPPMIPHDVEGMLPITIKNNQCLSCHDRANAETMKASMPNLTSIPASHYKDLRAEDQKDLSKLAGARFNCSQCHAPQSETKPLVNNEFSPDFQSEAEKSGSNLADTLNIGNDTLKD